MEQNINLKKNMVFNVAMLITERIELSQILQKL
jgi:hypothetical protein